MTQISTPDACHTCGVVDNASALPTTPQVPFQNPKRTFDLSYPADIFTCQRLDGRVELAPLIGLLREAGCDKASLAHLA